MKREMHKLYKDYFDGLVLKQQDGKDFNCYNITIHDEERKYGPSNNWYTAFALQLTPRGPTVALAISEMNFK